MHLWDPRASELRTFDLLRLFLTSTSPIRKCFPQIVREKMLLEDELQFADGPERYHTVHNQFHPTYRAKLYERAYYDIFFFDLNGDLIYSVFKDVLLKQSKIDVRGDGLRHELRCEWQRALEGLRAWSSLSWSLSQPGAPADFFVSHETKDNLTYIDWQPYGPSAYADAAFFSTGLRDEARVS